MRHKIFTYLLGIILFFLSSSFQNNNIITGKVVGIQDGDSITILLDNQEQVKVRLEGIDCPEKKQDFGTVAKQLTSDLVFSKKVIVHKTGKDRYGRILGYVFLPDNTNVNEELLKAGLAWHFVKYNKSSRLAKLESIAKSQKIGLWQLPNPVAPWDFRNTR